MFFIERDDTIRLRIMVMLRWCAIAGQLSAILVAQQFYRIDLPLGPCFLAVALSVVVNMVAMIVLPVNKRLSAQETTLMILMDVVQLGFLLYLTGGLSNPFCIMIVAPVAVSAIVLRLGSLVVLCAAALLIVSLLGSWYIPLRLQSGEILEMPRLFIFGNWAAIVITLGFMTVFAHSIVGENQAMSRALTATQMALAREQKLTDLGAVVAAAAHELGTPLSTITLTSAELVEELQGHGQLQDDARLIRAQADRCRDILRSMGHAGKEDRQLKSAPLSEILREAAEPHKDRGKHLCMTNGPGVEGVKSQPEVLRRPEIIHGLRNLIQNAVDFAQSKVWIETIWTEARISIRIIDDGLGFPLHIINRIGEPFLSTRAVDQMPTSQEVSDRYEGMGLGLFIAKVLLERSGAELSFANAANRRFLSPKTRNNRCGAIVEVTWPRHVLEIASEDKYRGLGQNLPLEI